MEIIPRWPWSTVDNVFFASEPNKLPLSHMASWVHLPHSGLREHVFKLHIEHDSYAAPAAAARSACEVGGAPLGCSRLAVKTSTNIWWRESWTSKTNKQKKTPLKTITASLGRWVKKYKGFLLVMLLVSSCNRELSIQLAAPCFGTFPIQSLGCRSVVSGLTHACPVRSNLLAACREMGLIKSLTEISPTLIWAMQKEREGVGGEDHSPKNNPPKSQEPGGIRGW